MCGRIQSAATLLPVSTSFCSRCPLLWNCCCFRLRLAWGGLAWDRYYAWERGAPSRVQPMRALFSDAGATATVIAGRVAGTTVLFFVACKRCERKAGEARDASARGHPTPSTPAEHACITAQQFVGSSPKYSAVVCPVVGTVHQKKERTRVFPSSSPISKSALNAADARWLFANNRGNKFDDATRPDAVRQRLVIKMVCVMVLNRAESEIVC